MSTNLSTACLPLDDHNGAVGDRLNDFLTLCEDRNIFAMVHNECLVDVSAASGCVEHQSQAESRQAQFRVFL